MNRRELLKNLGIGLTAVTIGNGPLSAALPQGRIRKPIPVSGEKLPVVGMGTWQTFNVGWDPELRDARTKVLQAFFEAGGGMIDSSPMYGSSQEVVGYGLKKLGGPDGLFAADKVWTSDGDATRRQTLESADNWNLERFDLMQVHNLRSWRSHLENLRRLKAEGTIRYIGITTSHGRRHRDFERVMKEPGIDFVQLTYNATHREVENRLLPLAEERGIAVIANRPFDGGYLVKGIQRAGHRLPEWAGEFGCSNWPEFLLKFIVSHPAVTCAIPATARVEHMKENMGAAHGELPDARMRRKMASSVASL